MDEPRYEPYEPLLSTCDGTMIEAPKPWVHSAGNPITFTVFVNPVLYQQEIRILLSHYQGHVQSRRQGINRSVGGTILKIAC